VEESC